jgi:hypothetical protein
MLDDVTVPDELEVAAEQATTEEETLPVEPPAPVVVLVDSARPLVAPHAATRQAHPMGASHRA